jgi:hypothetical protein
MFVWQLRHFFCKPTSQVAHEESHFAQTKPITVYPGPHAVHVKLSRDKNRPVGQLKQRSAEVEQVMQDSAQG